MNISSDADNGISPSHRKSATFIGEGGLINVIRTFRYQNLGSILEGAATGGSFPLPKVILNSIRQRNVEVFFTLFDWPMSNGVYKFTVVRKPEIFTLSAIDLLSQDTYRLTSPEWEHIRLALQGLSGSQIQILEPNILNIYNPFSAFAPFNTPSPSDFENSNNKIVPVLLAALKEIEEKKSAGLLYGKVRAEYYEVLAKIEKLNSLVRGLDAPLPDDFENEILEN